MKFVKGDTIAGIIVVLVNIIGGIIIAVVQQGMPLDEAVRTYSVLSIGDGLCGQIPSLLISLSAGIVVTRVPSEKRQNLASELSSQIARQPQALILTALVLILLAVIPGFPFMTLALFAALLALPFMVLRRNKGAVTTPGGANAPEKESMMPGACPLMLRLTPALHFPELVSDIDAMRWRLFEDYGVPLPEVNIEVVAAESSHWLSILLYQEPVFSLTLPAEAHYLVQGTVPGVEGQCQTLPDGMGQISWLSQQMGEKARELGMNAVTGAQRITTLLECVLLRHMAEFIGVQETRYLMDAMEKRYGELVKELQRQLPISKVTETLQRLVAEQVSIRDLRLIFGTLIDWAPREKEALMLTEYVRIALRRHILHRLNPHGKALPVLRIGEGIENLIRESIRQTAMGAYAEISPFHRSRILKLIEQALEKSGQLLIVTSVDARRFLRKITDSTWFDVPVLSWQEIGEASLIQVMESIDLNEEGSDENER